MQISEEQFSNLVMMPDKVQKKLFLGWAGCTSPDTDFISWTRWSQMSDNKVNTPSNLVPHLASLQFLTMFSRGSRRMKT